MGTIKITATRSNSSTSELTVTEKNNRVITVEDVHEVNEDGVGLPVLTSLHIAEANTGSQYTRVVFEDTCTPDNPLYFKWINSLGGWSYRMFSHSQEYKHKRAKVNTYLPWLVREEPIASEVIQRNLYKERVYGAEINRTVTVGTGFNGVLEKRELLGMLYSPVVYMWLVESRSWIEVTLDKQTLSENTSTYVGQVEYTLTLPTSL